MPYMSQVRAVRLTRKIIGISISTMPLVIYFLLMHCKKQQQKKTTYITFNLAV